MTYIPAELRRAIVTRASGCCEYCLIHQDDYYVSHEADHIISEKHGGQTDLNNLCLSCLECNRYKGSDVGSIDQVTDSFVALFNPRKMLWADHFQLKANVIVPLTAQGRVTVFLLQLNSKERLQKRAILIPIERYPCPSNP